MKKVGIFLAAHMACGSMFSDTLELADSSMLEGDIVGSSKGIIILKTPEGI